MVDLKTDFIVRAMNHKVLFFFGLCFSVIIASCHRSPSSATKEDEHPTPREGQPTYRFGLRVDTLSIDEHTIQSGESLSSIFTSLGYTGTEVDRICRTVSGHWDPRKVAAGKPCYILRSLDCADRARYVVFENSPTLFLIVDLHSLDSVACYPFEKEVVLRDEHLEGVITSSLWDAIIQQGGDPLLALKLSDLYAWQIDFFDVKEYDAFNVNYEVAYVDDTVPLHIGKINGAVFTHQGVDFYAIPFMQDSVLEYFDGEGNSLRKAFLKSPLDFYRITSRFSNSRYHPVLKKRRAHHGVDYAAPVGTPVKSIGDGTVTSKAFQKRGGGIYLKIKHNATYTTTYMHLSGFAKGLKVGSRVKQGDVIGYVGSTGLSTGPHLDFRIHKNGHPIDPLKMESPPLHPVREELRTSFDSVKKTVVEVLQRKPLE